MSSILSVSKPHFALVVLVISSEGESYAQFRECWRAYMHSFPEVKAFFVLAKEDLPMNLLVEEDRITVRSPDNKIPGILNKSYNAMHWCDANLSYDAMLRTNLSTFVHVPNVLAFMHPGLAGSHLCFLPAAGDGAMQHAIIDRLLGQGEGAKFQYLHGAFILLSQDVLNRLFCAVAVMDASMLETVRMLPDDVALSVLLRLSGAPTFKNLCAFKHQSTLAEQGARTDYAADVLWVRNKTTTNACMNVEERCAIFRAHDIRCYVNQVRSFYGKLATHSAMPPTGPRSGPRVVDCFSFGVELDMLIYRLSVLDAEVDVFILVEATRTHTGHTKPLVFAENAMLFASYIHKIVHVIVDDLVEKPDLARNEQWDNEMHQRDMLASGIKKLGLKPDDIILFSDLDEIPDPATVRVLREGPFPEAGIVGLNQRVHYGGVEMIANEGWTSAKAMTHAAFLSSGMGLSQIRSDYSRTDVVARGGWHLTYFGDANFVRAKLAASPHQEFNTPEVRAGVEARRAAGEDVLGRKFIQLTRVTEAANDYPPPRFAFLKHQFG